MPLFGKDYKSAAKAELDRNMRKIEEERKELAKKEFDAAVMVVTTNLAFARAVELITEEEAEAYRKRMDQAAKEFTQEKMEKAYSAKEAQTEQQKEDDWKRGTMEQVNAEIAAVRKEQAQAAMEAQTAKEAEAAQKNQQGQTEQGHSSDEMERTVT